MTPTPDDRDRAEARKLVTDWIGHAPCMPSDPWWDRQETLATALATARQLGKEES